jgi:hypothetical protein
LTCDSKHTNYFFLGLICLIKKYCVGPLLLLLPKLYIIWLSNLSILSVPDEGYSRSVLCELNLISVFLFKRCWCLIFKIISKNCHPDKTLSKIPINQGKSIYKIYHHKNNYRTPLFITYSLFQPNFTYTIYNFWTLKFDDDKGEWKIKEEKYGEGTLLREIYIKHELL